MPFTPVHMGAGMLVKAGLRERFSLMMFGWSQIVMDIQPLLVMIAGHGHVHGITHTYAGAVVIAVVATITGKHLAEFGLVLLELPQHRPITWRVALSSAFVGTMSHVLLDSVMHADLQPFAPWRGDNPFLGLITVDALHWACFGTGGLGLLLYPVVAALWPAQRRASREREQARRVK